MRFCWKIGICALLAGAPLPGLAANCTTQAEMQPQDRNALVAAGESLTTAIMQQDYTALQAQLLPAISAQWDGIHNEVEQGAAVLKGGQPQLDEMYLLDASGQTAPTDMQFFCSNQSGSLTVTISMHALPAGRYAVLLATAPGAALGGQIGAVMVWDATGSAPGWKLGGLSIRQGAIGGHDGVWYWTQARAAAATGSSWPAWYSYEFARYLLVPVDFLSSPNMEKLLREQSEIKGQPGPFPLTIQDGQDGARAWKIDSIHIDTALREADLGITYESLGMTDPAAARTEAIAVLSAVVRAHPELRQSFHGLWAYASHDGKVTPMLELPMAQIP